MLKNSLVFFIIVIPIILWFNIHGFNLSLYGIGQLAGLMGMVLFAISLILTARLKFFENYKDHHTLGTFSLILLLAHPLSLSMGRFSFFIPTINTPYIFSGELSLAIMIVLLSVTFYFSLRYHVWKSTHQWLGLAFIIGFFHMMLASSDFSASPILKIYFIFLSLFAISSFFYKYIRHYYSYRVVKINQLNSSHTEILMEPVNQKITFCSGQFAFFKFESQTISNEPHPFSIASSPSETYLHIVVKKLGDYTSNINQVKVGDIVKINGPYGKFSPHFHHNDSSIWIAGGVGITPFIGMARDYKADLYYAFSNSTEAILLDEFKNNSNLNFFPCDSSLSGRLTADKIKDYQNKDIYFCGPPAMIHSLIGQFIKLGVDKNRLISEDFQFQ